MGNFKKFTRSKFSGRDSDRPGRRDSGFSRDERPSRKFNRGSSDRPERSSRLEMFEVTCDKCKRRCEVPFKPSGERPVYCRDCFRKNESSDFRGNDVPEFRENPNSNSGELDKINRKLDKILKALKIE